MRQPPAVMWSLTLMIAGATTPGLAGGTLQSRPVVAASEPGTDLDSPEPPVESPLSGPRVAAKAEPQRTLVQWTLDGELQDIGADPERAAIELLELTDEQRSQFERIEIERSLLLDRLLSENYALLIELGSVDPSSSGDMIRALQRAAVAFRPYLDRGTFLHEMQGGLTIAQADEARRLVDEYWQARIDVELQRTNERGLLARVGARSRVRWESLGRQIEEALQGRAATGEQEFERVVQRLHLTPAQAERVRIIFTAIFLAEFQGRQAPLHERLSAVRQTFELLDPDQRVKFHIWLAEERRLEHERKPNKPERAAGRH